MGEKAYLAIEVGGLASWINPLDIALTFEVFFLQEKTVSERSESVDLTDKE